MTAQTTRGKTVILRPHIIGKAMDPYNAYDSQALLRIGTYVGMARTGTSILGVFNVSLKGLSEFVHLSSFPGTEHGEYIISSFVSNSISPPMSRGVEQAIVGLELETRGWDILTAYPLRHFTVKQKPVAVSMMGLLGKMTGSAAVTGYDMYVETNGRLRIWTSLKALGVMGLYISDLESRSIENDFMIMILGRPISVDRVRKSKTSGKILEVDVEKAWKDSGERPGWSNEVSIEVFMQ